MVWFDIMQEQGLGLLTGCQRAVMDSKIFYSGSGPFILEFESCCQLG